MIRFLLSTAAAALLFLALLFAFAMLANRKPRS